MYARVRRGLESSTLRIHGVSASAWRRAELSFARNSSSTTAGIKTSWKRSRRRSSRPRDQREMRGLLLRTTGSPGIFQVLLQLLGLLPIRRKAVSAQQEKESLSRNSRQLSGETGA